MADDKKRPEPPLIDKNKGRLVEEPERKAPTPAEKDVKVADEDLNNGQKQPSCTASAAELAAAENEVRRVEGEVAALKDQPGCDVEHKRMEEELARLIETRNALFREVAGND